jgi:hypothetical protein
MSSPQLGPPTPPELRELPRNSVATVAAFGSAKLDVMSLTMVTCQSPVNTTGFVGRRRSMKSTTPVPGGDIAVPLVVVDAQNLADVVVVLRHHRLLGYHVPPRLGAIEVPEEPPLLVRAGQAAFGIELLRDVVAPRAAELVVAVLTCVENAELGEAAVGQLPQRERQVVDRRPWCEGGFRPARRAQHATGPEPVVVLAERP